MLNIAFDEKWKSVLQKRTHIATIWSVAITDWEKMAVLQAHNVWVSNVCILVNFVGVVSRDTAFGSKRKLGNDVHNLVRGRHFVTILFFASFSSLLLICFARVGCRACILLGWLRDSSHICFLFIQFLLWRTSPSSCIGTRCIVFNVLRHVTSMWRRLQFLLKLKLGAFGCIITRILVLIVLLLQTHSSWWRSVFDSLWLLLHTL